MLAIDWNNEQVRLVDGRVVRGQISLRQAVAYDLPADLNPSDAVALGAFLRNCLQQAGMSGKKAVSCIERRNLVLKNASMGEIAEDEIPDAVRLLAMRDLTIPIEEATVDYRLIAPEDGQEQYLLYAVVRNQTIEHYREVFSAAGLRLDGLWPNALAQAATAASILTLDPTGGETTGTHQLLLVADGDTLALSLLRDQHFVMSIARPLANRRGAEDKTEPLFRAMQRLNASLSTTFHDLAISSVLLARAGGTDEVMEKRIAEQFGAPVRVFDPLSSLAETTVPIDQHGAFASTVGSLILAQRSPADRINFLIPKRPAAKQDRRRVAAIALAGALLLGGQQTKQYYQSHEQRISQFTSKAKAKERKAAKELKALRISEAQAAIIENWQQDDVVWLEVLRRLAENAPDPRHAFFTTMNLSRARRSGGAGALVRVEGYAVSQQAVADMNRQLVEQGGFEVRPGSVQPAGRVAGYRWRFSADIGFRPSEPEAEPEKAPP